MRAAFEELSKGLLEPVFVDLMRSLDATDIEILYSALGHNYASSSGKPYVYKLVSETGGINAENKQALELNIRVLHSYAVVIFDERPSDALAYLGQAKYLQGVFDALALAPVSAGIASYNNTKKGGASTNATARAMKAFALELVQKEAANYRSALDAAKGLHAAIEKEALHRSRLAVEGDPFFGKNKKLDFSVSTIRRWFKDVQF